MSLTRILFKTDQARNKNLRHTLIENCTYIFPKIRKDLLNFTELKRKGEELMKRTLLDPDPDLDHHNY